MFRAANAELAALHLTSEQASRFKTALKVFEHLDKNGHATSFASVLGAYFLIADTLAGKAFKDRAATLESFGNIAKTVDSAEGPVKLMAWTLRRIGENSPEEVAALKNIKAPNTSVETVAAGKATPAAKWLLRAKLLGPAGDLLMAASAKTKLEAAANAGDVNGALVNCGKYGSALVAFTPGAYLAAAGVAGFSTGPGAPIVWLIATGVYVGASLYEDSDQEKLMRKLQVHKDNRPK